MINIKTPEQIAGIKSACEIWKKVRTKLIEYIKPGISTKSLDKYANKVIRSFDAISTFYKLYDFPGYICISVNDQIIHGIGNDYIIKENDLITCDVGVTYNNYVCDAAFSIIVAPNNNIEAQKILNATYECLIQGIKQIKPNAYLGDISWTIENTAKKNNYEVIKNYGGHGCGLAPHEDPIILDYGEKNTGIKLIPGMVLCIEPMLLTDSDKHIVDKSNHWTVYSKNHKLTCHYEHMVLVTNTGYEILTLSNDPDELKLFNQFNN